ncbi:phage stabilization protein [Caudoviricetes sp.]|nr:phage stabilization protein [Caudoviricetes sp.]
MQIPILSGIYSSKGVDLRTKYPRNLIPVAQSNGISAGYLRPAEGISQFGTGLAVDRGVDRGGINWNGVCYRVMGDYLVSVGSDGVCTEIGSVGGTGQVTLDYSFDRLAIASGGKLYYWNGSTLTQVTDSDLGTVIDFVWIDGYFLTTDGASLVVTELNDPTAVNPLKYGSSEVDPDNIVAVKKIRNELYAINRYTTEVFDNIGGDLFPFSRIEGAQLPKGALGTHCVCNYLDRITFLGSGRNESPAVWSGANGQVEKLSTREIDTILATYTSSELEDAILEARSIKGQDFLYIHLPNETLVYDNATSQLLEQSVWFTLTTSVYGNAMYQARNFVYCYDKWIVGNPVATNTLGYMNETTSSHYDSLISWEFGTQIIYNEGRGAIFHELELVALTGRYNLNDAPIVWTSYSLDGANWSQEKACYPGARGNFNQRIMWLQQGTMRNFRIQKFRGTSDNYTSFLRLEARLEALN